MVIELANGARTLGRSGPQDERANRPPHPYWVAPSSCSSMCSPTIERSSDPSSI